MPRPADVLSGPDLFAWRDFEREHRELRRSPRTVESRLEAVCQLAAWLRQHSGRTLLTAESTDISDYLIARKTAATAYNRHSALRAFYKFCVAEEIITASPMERVKAPSPNFKVPAVIPDEDLQLLIRACEGRDLAALRDSAMIRLLCEPGSPRRNELTLMDVADVNMDADLAVIRHGKYSRERIVPMSPRTARAMSRYLRARARHPRAGETGRLWLGTKGPLTVSGVRLIVARRSEQAGIGHVHPHQLRHTAFSDFDSASGNVNHAMALFGWSSPAMAYHYGKAARAGRAVQAAQDLARGNRL
jgi:site-specific recombinase XerD